VSSSARQPNSSEESVASYPDVSVARFKAASPVVRAANGLTASSFEFVAKPEQAASATLLLPLAIQSGLEDMPGFAGSLVMVSDQEARLITVIVFWSGTEARRSCERSVRRVRALLAPYLDRCLRTQNLLARFPAQKDDYSQASSIDTRLIAHDSIAQEANVCAA
jgi:hypothetical protein